MGSESWRRQRSVVVGFRSGRARGELREGRVGRGVVQTSTERDKGKGEAAAWPGSSAASVECCMHSTEQLRGVGRKTPGGEAGLGRLERWASPLARGKPFSFFLFNLSFLFFFSVVCFDFGKNTKSFY